MKIAPIFLIQNNTRALAKHGSLAPLSRDTVMFSDSVTFSAKKKSDFPYSSKQKEEEIALISHAIKNATETGELLDADKISEITGLDIYVVKLRLSTNKEIRLLVTKMQAASNLKAKTEDVRTTLTVIKLLETIRACNQKLTHNEIAFYAGISKEKLFEIVENANLSKVLETSLLKIKNTPLLERKAQTVNINRATNYIDKKDTYDSLSKETELSPEIIRTRISENDEMFNRVVQNGLYPPDIYSLDAAEKQDDIILDTLVDMIRLKIPFDTDTLIKRTGLFPGTVMIRFRNNSALRETRDRMMGVNDDED